MPVAAAAPAPATSKRVAPPEKKKELTKKVFFLNINHINVTEDRKGKVGVVL